MDPVIYNLKRLRREKGFSRADLAREMRVSRQYISNLEKSDSLTLKALRKLSTALEVDIAEFLKPIPTKED